LSHISTYRANIRVNPVRGSQHDTTWQLLEEAIASVAEEHEGRIDEYVTDYFGRRTRVDFALITPTFRNGVGVNVDPKTGEVRFLYDDYGYQRGVIDSLCEELVQSYTALAVSRALDALNYSVEYEESKQSAGERRVVVRGVL